jgi:hypothetical protein
LNLSAELFAVIDALQRARLEFALCGGFAVIIHGYPRLTTDIDVLVQEQDLDPARAALAAIGYSLDSGLLVFATGKPQERRLWRVAKAIGSELLTVDLLLVNPFLATVWQERELYLIEGRRVPVVSRRGLLAMKRAAGRHKDLDDIEQLGLERDA